MYVYTVYVSTYICIYIYATLVLVCRGTLGVMLIVIGNAPSDWTFKRCTTLFAFHITLIPLQKA